MGKTTIETAGAVVPQTINHEVLGGLNRVSCFWFLGMLLAQGVLAQTPRFAVKTVANDCQLMGLGDQWSFSVVGINNFNLIAGSRQWTLPGKWSMSDACMWREDGTRVTLAMGSVYAPPPAYGGTDGTNFSSSAISDNGIALGVFGPGTLHRSRS